MNAFVEVNINGTKEAIWNVISDIKNSHKNISGIQKVEILKEASGGIIGLKWRETRTMFGKEATEDMWITHSEPNSYYKTRAESHGAVYITTMKIEEKDNFCILSMNFESESVSFVAKIMNIIFSGMMKKSTKKALLEDLNDIKNLVEGNKEQE
jgi:hypothetical protein